MTRKQTKKNPEYETLYGTKDLVFWTRQWGVADRGDGGKNCSTLKRDLKDLTNKSNM